MIGCVRHPEPFVSITALTGRLGALVPQLILWLQVLKAVETCFRVAVCEPYSMA